MKHASTKRASLSHDLALAYLGVQHAGEVRLKNVIDEHIARVIAASDDNVSAAAKLLGMHRRSLQRHLRRRERVSKRRR
jgi:ActR/RegA family two-component response regulator